MKRFIIAGFLLVSSASAADLRATLEERLGKLEGEVAALKEENRKLRENAAVEERNRARRIYTENILPMLRPMLKDFGMDESLLVPVDKIETLADAYRPLLAMVRKISEVAELR